jgi:hypothetical protein
MSSVKELLRGNVIDGSGTANYVPRWSDSGTLTDSLIEDDGTTVSVGGVLAVSGDVSIADKIIHTGDTNTAIRFPAADTVTVETDGSERMRIDSSGSLLVGLTSRVSGLSGFTQLEVSGGEGGITINSNTTTADKYGRLMFTKSGAVGNEGLIRYNVNDYHMSFWTDATERMRITSGGNVGIGTSSPINTLNISGTLGIVNSTANGYLIDFSAVQQSFGISRSFSSPVAFLDLIAGGSPVNLGSWRGGIRFRVGGYDQLGQDASDTMHVLSGAVTIFGSLSKSSGSFKIEHPLEEKKDTHYLVHSFVESPQANNIYRGKVQLLDGMATVNLDEVSTMTEGTFVALNRDIHTYTSNESDWDAVRGSVEGNILTIECQNSQSTATVSWLVIGERQDKHMFDTDWTDENGKVIVEPEK